MKNLKLKNKIGRPKYIPDNALLKELFEKVDKKSLTNSEAWHIAGCGKTKWYELKRRLRTNEKARN